MPDKKTGRDFPLAPTSMPQAIDNTYVKKKMQKGKKLLLILKIQEKIWPYQMKCTEMPSII